MKHLYKVAALVIGLSLVGCKTPPTPFPDDAKEQNTVNLTGHQNLFSHNDFERKTDWLYHLKNHGSVVNNENFALFWYLAEHSDRITIYGGYDTAKELKRNLLRDGNISRINVVNLCYLSSAPNCGGDVEVFFQKGHVQLPISVNSTMFTKPIYYR